MAPETAKHLRNRIKESVLADELTETWLSKQVKCVNELKAKAQECRVEDATKAAKEHAATKGHVAKKERAANKEQEATKAPSKPETPAPNVSKRLSRKVDHAIPKEAKPTETATKNDDDSITPSYVDDGSVLLTPRQAGKGAQPEKGSPSKVQGVPRMDRHQTNSTPQMPVRVRPDVRNATASRRRQCLSTPCTYIPESDLRRAKGEWDELRKWAEEVRESAPKKRETASPALKTLASPLRGHSNQPEFERAARDWDQVRKRVERATDSRTSGYKDADLQRAMENWNELRRQVEGENAVRTAKQESSHTTRL
ncbi:MAG: hypothetical protein Q9165_008034 [Trypethelium subeluteriae]